LASEQADFGEVSRLEADAVGRPGQRAFRVLVESERGSACLWVEREQLQALAMLVEQLLTGWPAIQIHTATAASGAKKAGSAAFTSSPDVDFKVGQLALGFDERASRYVLLAHKVDTESGDEADFICQATRAQLRTLSESIPALLSAGRPRCPMCEAPLGRGAHRCARSNGHVRGVES
jgi:uncharacterized repeat protein (TIGR03847 family)